MRRNSVVPAYLERKSVMPQIRRLRSPYVVFRFKLVSDSLIGGQIENDPSVYSCSAVMLYGTYQRGCIFKQQVVKKFNVYQYIISEGAERYPY